MLKATLARTLWKKKFSFELSSYYSKYSIILVQYVNPTIFQRFHSKIHFRILQCSRWNHLFWRRTYVYIYIHTRIDCEFITALCQTVALCTTCSYALCPCTLLYVSCHSHNEQGLLPKGTITGLSGECHLDSLPTSSSILNKKKVIFVRFPHHNTEWISFSLEKPSGQDLLV